MEGREEAAGGQHEGSLRQQRPPVVHPVQVPSSHVGHADGSSGAVQELVAVPAATGIPCLSVCVLEGGGAGVWRGLTREPSGKASRSPGGSSLYRAEAESVRTRRI